MSSKPKPLLSNENEHLFISKKIKDEQQRLKYNDDKIKELSTRRQELLEKNKELEHRISFVRQKIVKQKEYDNPVIRQLREHFKALREQMKNMAFEEEHEDDIDIDNMTYEQLLELGQTIGKVSKGLSSQKFEALDKFQYDNELNLQEECTICRDEFVEGQYCIRLGCKHFFHKECLQGWVQVQKVCPNCKTEIS